ncbi:hypothetical protein CSUB01_05943 [Colletotrichum sublineola]|uniref:Uncharacterized protein n=1 Tax=Colletotrichum sublineola TaxID=1173701 RepID=A0A066X1T3_COLSU|nr:hypothetical protein CSUB01_05943 [Colletotrichum sublineola]
MCQLCPRLQPSCFNSEGEEVERKSIYEEEEEGEEYRPPSPPSALKTVVQPAPSHDGAPTFALYDVPIDTQETEAELRPVRPQFGIVVYDVTPTANPSRIAQLALTLHGQIISCNGHHPGERLELVALPLPQCSDDEHVEACIRHHEEEIRTRMLIDDKAEAASWFLPERIKDRVYARNILIINCFKDDSSDDAVVASLREALLTNEGRVDWATYNDPNATRCGTYLYVTWRPRNRRPYTLTYEPDDSNRRVLKFAFLPDDTYPKSPEVNFYSGALENSRSALMEMVDALQPFYNHFVPDGVLNRELLKARKGC